MDGSRLMKLLFILFLSVPARAADGEILKLIRQALEQRAAELRNFSAEAAVRRDIEGGSGGQAVETVERIYLGEKGQFKKEVVRANRGGRPAAPGQLNVGGGFPGPMGAELQIFDQPHWLTPEVMNKAKLLGQESVQGKLCYKVGIRPRISALQVYEAHLWAETETGMPLKLEVRFGLGDFIQEADLVQELRWDERKKITVPHQQRVRLQAGRGGLGLTIQISTTWRHYEWDLQLDSDFFRTTRAGSSSRRLTAAAGERGLSPPDEDPFEELELLPRDGSTGQPAPMDTSPAREELVVIEGSSSAAGSGRDDQPGLQRLFPGMRKGLDGAGPGSRDRQFGGGFDRGGLGGGGGLAGGAGWGGRGALIAGSRANRPQGSLQTSFSGSILDARPFSLTGEETTEPDYSMWDSGVSLGIPLSGGGTGRRRMGSFLFLSYDTRRGRELQSAFASLPTLSERQGDFSRTTYRSRPLAGSAVQIYDPVTGAAYSNATIPSDQIHPIAQSLLRYIPLPNRLDPFLNYYSEQLLGNHRDRLNLRLSHALTETFHLTGAYSMNRSASDSFNVFPELASRRSALGQNVSVIASQRWNRGLMHSLQTRFNRNRSHTSNPFAFRQNISSDMGIPNTSEAPVDFGLPTLRFTNYTSLRDGNSSFSVREELTVGDSWMVAQGRHFFRFGVEYAPQRRNVLGSAEGSGTLTFAGIGTSQYLKGSLPRPGSGYDFADFLLGRVQSSSIQHGNSDHYYRGYRFSLYLDDNYRMHSRFTLQWGVRYTLASPWTEKYDRLGNLDIGPAFTAVFPLTPSTNGPFSGVLARALLEADRDNIAPRVGLAFRLDRQTVLRASYGVFHPHEVYQQIAGELGSQPPYAFTVQHTAEGRNFIDLSDPFSQVYVADIPNTYAVDPHFRLQTVQNWNVSVQRSLGRLFFVSAGYAGSRGTGLELLRAPNRYEEGRQRIENAAQFLYLSSGASSVFHGLQVMALRRMRSGFSFAGQYEFGKSLDNAASIAGGPRTVAQNDDDLRSERGRSSFDVRHRASLRWTWEMPFGSRHRWLREPGLFNSLLGNWYVTGNFSAGSGRPFTARVLGNQINNSRSGSFASERSSATGQSPDLPSSQRTSTRFFNTEAFRLPEPGSFGNTGRNTITGPGSWTVNVSLHRTLALKGDSLRLLLSVQARNVLNHVNYTSIDTVVNSRGFGRVTSAGPMRTLQVNLRLLF